jgi:hypothetical protein
MRKFLKVMRKNWRMKNFLVKGKIRSNKVSTSTRDRKNMRKLRKLGKSMQWRSNRKWKRTKKRSMRIMKNKFRNRIEMLKRIMNNSIMRLMKRNRTMNTLINQTKKPNSS